MIFGIVILKIIWIFGIRAFFSYFCDTQYSETITLKTGSTDIVRGWRGWDANVIDFFHVMKNQCDALDCIRMRFKCKAIVEQNKEKKGFNRKKKERRKARERYR